MIDAMQCNACYASQNLQSSLNIRTGRHQAKYM